jgi:hypothetical protein
LPLALIVAASSGCGRLKRLLHPPEPSPSVAAVVHAPTGPTPPKIDYATVRPNELGRIPVVMYHEIGGKPDKKDPGLNRTVEEFKGDLQALYDAGFRPVNMSDVVRDNIDVPAGKSPVVLTFDDARATQFKLIETDKAQQIDPNCAVGIMTDFHKTHPDWPMKATFYVLPKSKMTLDAFGQYGLGDQKMQYLVSQGFEIGNHTTFHKRMTNMTPDQIQTEIGNANNEIEDAVPGIKIYTMAVPMGLFPHKQNVQYLIHGSYQGKPYDYLAAMAASWRPIPSPSSKAFNPMHLERITPADGLNGLHDWIQRLTHGGDMYTAYISDGDPNVISVPKGMESQLNLPKLKAEGKLVNTYSAFGGFGGAKPIVAGDTGATPDTAAPGPAAPAGDGAAAGDGKPAAGADAAPATVTEKPIVAGGG